MSIHKQMGELLSPDSVGDNTAHFDFKDFDVDQKTELEILSQTLCLKNLKIHQSPELIGF